MTTSQLYRGYEEAQRDMKPLPRRVRCSYGRFPSLGPNGADGRLLDLTGSASTLPVLSRNPSLSACEDVDADRVALACGTCSWALAPIDKLGLRVPAVPPADSY